MRAPKPSDSRVGRGRRFDVLGKNDKALGQLRREHLQKKIIRRAGRSQDDDAPADDAIP